ncbi:hypothetical protein ASC80_22605 [Afipia sp. Root123D2]|uniref:tetratricopeptide repeat protein n=1 Tax=Afipia sp. Root123D2 TaxID=1736436 RepID=UPI0006F51921|nr:tetratricopeptide repeat protein [Afipia sp. Root123D2]KQW17372.1 hypothetical protein ASC80_22605 [Afipia sp. Root123D2]
MQLRILGDRYVSGTGVPKDEAKGFYMVMNPALKGEAEWYRQAAEQGNADAQLMLGLGLITGRGVSKDQIHGLEWVHRSANQGNLNAYRALGYMYARGIAVRADTHKAADWYREAIAKGSEVARKEFEMLELPKKIAISPAAVSPIDELTAPTSLRELRRGESLL